MLLILAAIYNNRNADGTYDNMQNGFRAFNLRDYQPVTYPRCFQRCRWQRRLSSVGRTIHS